MIEKRRPISYTLFKYIASETAFSFLVAFLFFFCIFFVNQLLLMAEDILSKRAPFGQVALLILFSLPSIVAMSAPFASLVGTLLAIGRLASDNEILVMRASGLSYLVVYFPVVVVGCCISLASFFTNDVLLPAGTLEFGRLYKKLTLSTPAVILESNSVKKFKDTIIVTGTVHDKSLDQLLILDRTENGERRMIMASEARLEEKETNSLTLSVKNAFIHSETDNPNGNYDYTVAKELEYSIRQQDIMQSIAKPGPREMASRDVFAEIIKRRADVNTKFTQRSWRVLDTALNAEGAFRSGPINPRWNERTRLLEKYSNEVKSQDEILKDRNLRIFTLEFYKKFTIPLAALCFVFLSTPLGLFSRKSGQSMNIGLGIVISIMYWALLIGGQTLGVRLGYSPFWSTWIPNIAILSAGGILSLIRFLR